MFSAAGRQPDTPPGPGIAAVSSMGSLGFLAGPPLIGFLADATSLPWALATLILGAVASSRSPAARRAGRARARRARATAAPRAGGGAMSFAAVISDFDGVLADSTRRHPAAPGRAGATGSGSTARRSRRPTTAVPARAVVAEHVRAGPASRPRRRGCSTPRSRTPAGVVALPGAADVLALPGRRDRDVVRDAARPRPARAPPGSPAPDVLVTADQVARGKPAPDPYLLAAERLGVDPADCLVLEDAPARRRRRPRRGDDRLGGHHDPRAGRARRARTGSPRGLPELLADLDAAARRLSSAGISAQPSRAGGGIVGASGSSAAAREPATVSGHAAARASSMSFVLSPTASTSSGEQPTAAQNDSTPAHFETPGAIAVMPQPGQIGSGAQVEAEAGGVEGDGDRPRSALGPARAPRTRRRARTGSSRPRSAVRVTPSSDARCPGCDRRRGREDDVDVGLVDVDARMQPGLLEGGERRARPPSARTARRGTRVPSGCRPSAPFSPTSGSASRLPSSSARAPRIRRAVAASTGTPSASSSATAARVAGDATQSRPTACRPDR